MRGTRVTDRDWDASGGERCMGADDAIIHPVEEQGMGSLAYQRHRLKSRISHLEA